MLGSCSLAEEVTGIYSRPDTISKSYSREKEMTHVHWGALECHLKVCDECAIKNALKS